MKWPSRRTNCTWHAHRRETGKDATVKDGDVILRTLPACPCRLECLPDDTRTGIGTVAKWDESFVPRVEGPSRRGECFPSVKCRRHIGTLEKPGGKKQQRPRSGGVEGVKRDFRFYLLTGFASLSMRTGSPSPSSFSLSNCVSLSPTTTNTSFSGCRYFCASALCSASVRFLTKFSR